MKKTLLFFSAFLFLLLFSNKVKSQAIPMNITGLYTQDFDLLGTTTPVPWVNNSNIPNWYAQRTGTGSNIVAGDGSSNAGNLYNFGTNLALDRALGSVGSNTPGHFAWGVMFQNTSLAPISTIYFQYTGEQWRNGGNITPQSASFYYKVSPTPITDLQPNTNTSWTHYAPLDFTSLINTITASALDGNLPANRTTLGGPVNDIIGLVVPSGYYVMFKWDDPNHAGNDHGLSIDDLAVMWIVPTNYVAIDTVAVKTYCITPTAGANVDVPYSVLGTFNPGNNFEAYLSDALGDFTSETLIGTIASQVADTIHAVIPPNTPSGTGYRIRVKATNPGLVGGQNDYDLTIVLGLQEVTAASATAGYSQAGVNWTNPTVCYDEVMIVAKPNSSVVAIPSGNGSAYTANSQSFTDPLNTTFDATGKVVYKSTTPVGPINITNLTNWTPYHFQIYTRRDTFWSPGVEVIATPVDIANIAISEIMYNTGGGVNDSLEFIELINKDVVSINLNGYYFSSGIADTLHSAILNPGDRMIVAKDSVAFTNFFGIPAQQWYSGSLTNTGEPIAIRNNLNFLIDSLNYLDVAPWPTNALYRSITLCNTNLEDSVGSNWSLSTEFVDTLNTGDSIFANPGFGCTVIIIPDTLAPHTDTAYATSLNTVQVVFSEAVDAITAEDVANYTFLSAVAGSAILSTSLDTVTITLSTPLVSGIADSITIANVTDTAGNPMALAQKYRILFGSIILQVDTIVYWNFPNTPDDQIADGGLPINLARTIRRENSYAGAYTFSGGVTTSAISSNGWNVGANTKYWIVDFSTALYDSIKFSSSQKGSNTGPRDMKAEYSFDGNTWNTISGTNMQLSTFFSSGTLTNIDLAPCNNQAIVYLRWLMTSDTCVADTFGVGTNGTSRIDDIYVTGHYNPILTAPSNITLSSMVYPNPSNGQFIVDMAGEDQSEINLYSMVGQLVYTTQTNKRKTVIDGKSLPKGLYFLTITNQHTKKLTSHKVVIQ